MATHSSILCLGNPMDRGILGGGGRWLQSVGLKKSRD